VVEPLYAVDRDVRADADVDAGLRSQVVAGPRLTSIYETDLFCGVQILERPVRSAVGLRSLCAQWE